MEALAPPQARSDTITIDVRSPIKRVSDHLRGRKPSPSDLVSFAGRMTVDNIMLKFDRPFVLGEKQAVVEVDGYELLGVIPLIEHDVWVECSVDFFVQK